MSKMVILLAKYDFAGSGNRIAEAISLNSNHYVLPIVTHPLDFPKQIRRVPSLFKRDKKLGVKGFIEDTDRIQALIDRADIIHFKGDSVPVNDFIQGVTIPPNKVKIVTVGGSFFRRGKNNVSFENFPIEEYVKRSDFRSAITPDLNYKEFDGVYIPHAYDNKNIKNHWVKRKVPHIVHTQSANNKKGTIEFKKVCAILKKENYIFTVDIVNNIPYTEAIKKVSKASIFFDQMSKVGWGGMSGIEAMSMGIPTVAYLSDIAFKQGNIKYTPVINCGNTVESLADTFRELLKGGLEDISKETFEYAKETYSYEVVGKRWAEIYEKL